VYWLGTAVKQLDQEATMPDHGSREGLRQQHADIGDRARAGLSPRSAEWDRALRSATARLNEGWVLPETECHPAMAEELAALLCAYHDSAA
jgi:hypothetical protein